jgi:hypothetical protein
MTKEDLILEELRALRATVEELAADSKQRLTYLEAHDQDISGNGQPGRMKTAETRITVLEHWRVYTVAVATTVATLFGILFKHIL